jgi:hypothetical protein
MNRNLSIFKEGKTELRKYYSIRLKTSTNFISFFLGFLIAVVIVLPIALMLAQGLMLYGYNTIYAIIFMLLIWLGLLLFNGISNYLTVVISKSLEKDLLELQKIKAKPIFFYQVSNFGFAIFSLIIIIFVAIQIIGVL